MNLVRSARPARPQRGEGMRKHPAANPAAPARLLFPCYINELATKQGAPWVHVVGTRATKSDPRPPGVSVGCRRVVLGRAQHVDSGERDGRERWSPVVARHFRMSRSIICCDKQYICFTFKMDRNFISAVWLSYINPIKTIFYR